MFFGDGPPFAVLKMKMTGGQPNPFDLRRQLQGLLFAHDEQRNLQTRRSAVDRKDAIVVGQRHENDKPNLPDSNGADPNSAPFWLVRWFVFE
jgi:hypothetical protein